MELEDALLALAIGITILFIAVPFIAVLLLSLVDVLARQDIGFSRLVWLGVILAVPLMGLGLYWLLRPKDFDPINDPKPVVPMLPHTRTLGGQFQSAREPARAAPAVLTPALQGGADPEEIEDSPDDAA